METNIDNNEDYQLTFEDFKNENGIVYWWASDLMRMLGYSNMKAFQKVLDKTTKAFMSLNISHFENIIHIISEEEECGYDFKLTRFACYLAVMNADPKKKEVAMAQAYFAQQTRKFELYLQHHGNEIDRLVIREEIVEGNKSLNSIASKAGVEDYARFTNAGYRGMYNMSAFDLEKSRNIKRGKLMDNMGRTELAANLFRITQTEERIKNHNIFGQNALEKTHYDVGRNVRKIVQDNVGRTPESLPQEKELPDVKKVLKNGYKNMLNEDSQKKKKLK